MSNNDSLFGPHRTAGYLSRQNAQSTALTPLDLGPLPLSPLTWLSLSPPKKCREKYILTILGISQFFESQSEKQCPQIDKFFGSCM